MDGAPPTWTREAVLSEFCGSAVTARDSEANLLDLPCWLEPLRNERQLSNWEDQADGIHEGDMPALARVWWDAINKPGHVQSATLRRHDDGGWHEIRISVLDLRHQPDAACVLVAAADLGPCEPPTRVSQPVHTAGDDEAIARYERPIWLLQELDRLGCVINTEGDTAEIFGRSAEEVVGRSVIEFLHPEDHPAALEMWTGLLGDPGSSRTIRQRILRPDGSSRWIESTVLNRLEGSESGVILSISHDITERRREERVLRRRAFTDPLTGLPNRLAVDTALARMLGTGAATVAFIDLDGFKSVNDEQGHRVGDRVLETVARRLSNAVEDDVTVGRWGGDEFVAVAAGDREDALRSAIDTAFADPVVLGEVVWHPRCSYGIAHGDARSEADQLVVSADTAMYEAKELRST